MQVNVNIWLINYIFKQIRFDQDPKKGKSKNQDKVRSDQIRIPALEAW
jgi:hypothetical protein